MKKTLSKFLNINNKLTKTNSIYSKQLAEEIRIVNRTSIMVLKCNGKTKAKILIMILLVTNFLFQCHLNPLNNSSRLKILGIPLSQCSLARILSLLTIWVKKAIIWMRRRDKESFKWNLISKKD